MIFACSVDAGKSEALTNLAADLTGFVAQAARDGASFDDLERGVFGRLLDMGNVAADLFLKAQGDGDLGPSIETDDGRVLYRSATVQPRPLRTIFGEQNLHTYVYSQGSKRKIDLRPIDACINLPEGKASYLLQEFSQLFCIEKAFGVGSRQFETVFRQKLSVDVLEDINRAMGAQADCFLDHLPTPPSAEEGALLVEHRDIINWAMTSGKARIALMRADGSWFTVVDFGRRCFAPVEFKLSTEGKT